MATTKSLLDDIYDLESIQFVVDGYYDPVTKSVQELFDYIDDPFLIKAVGVADPIPQLSSKERRATDAKAARARGKARAKSRAKATENSQKGRLAAFMSGLKKIKPHEWLKIANTAVKYGTTIADVLGAEGGPQWERLLPALTGGEKGGNSLEDMLAQRLDPTNKPRDVPLFGGVNLPPALRGILNPNYDEISQARAENGASSSREVDMPGTPPPNVLRALFGKNPNYLKMIETAQKAGRTFSKIPGLSFLNPQLLEPIKDSDSMEVRQQKEQANKQKQGASKFLNVASAAVPVVQRLLFGGFKIPSVKHGLRLIAAIGKNYGPEIAGFAKKVLGDKRYGKLAEGLNRTVGKDSKIFGKGTWFDKMGGWNSVIDATGIVGDALVGNYGGAAMGAAELGLELGWNNRKEIAEAAKRAAGRLSSGLSSDRNTVLSGLARLNPFRKKPVATDGKAEGQVTSQTPISEPEKSGGGVGGRSGFTQSSAQTAAADTQGASALPATKATQVEAEPADPQKAAATLRSIMNIENYVNKAIAMTQNKLYTNFAY